MKNCKLEIEKNQTVCVVFNGPVYNINAISLHSCSKMQNNKNYV